ncbi:MAG: hypothetical protein Q9174_002278 [Haloplaca sp. 1 TL-2023]
MAAPYDSTSFILTATYAAFVSLCHVLSSVNQRWAYGPPRKVRLLDEVVVITGGASGLGKCIAEVYSMKGVGVAVLDIGVGPKEKGEREGLGTPTVLINNAAIVNGKPFLSLTPEEVDNTFRVNAISHFHLSSLFLRPLITNKTPGTLVTISSILGRLGASNLSAYTATKASVIASHTSLTAELRSTPHIKTILVTPGQLDTPMFSHIKLDWLRNFFGPVVEVRELAMEIVKTIDSGNGGTIAMPAYARWIAWQQVLPRGVQNVLKRWAGVDGATMASTDGNSQGTRSREKSKLKAVIKDAESESESESGSE